MKIGLLLLLVWFIGGCQLKPQKSEIEIITDPTAKIYIDNVEMGTTSTIYKNSDLKPGEIELKLEPEETNLTAWSYKLKLNNLTTTVVSRKFDEEDRYSSGYVMYLEEIGENEEPTLVINSKPADASIKIDGMIMGRTPTKIEKMVEGDRQVVISYPGYENQTLFVKMRKGYQVVVDVWLAMTKIEIPEMEEEVAISQNVNIKKVKIKETGTGWLRVRDVPSTQGREVAKVDVGSEYEMIEGDETDWYQIKVDEEISGWISAEYAEIVEE